MLSVQMGSRLPQLMDRTRKSGITWKHTSGTPQKKYLVETMGSGVCLFDYDGDGLVDIYLVNGSTREQYLTGKGPRSALYRNLGNGKFEDVTERAHVGNTGWGMGCSVADYDNDGDLDLFVTNFGANVFYENQGNGIFVDKTLQTGLAHPRWNTGAAFGDYDKDGFLDVYVAGYVDFQFETATTEGRFCSYHGVPVACGPKGLKGAQDVLYRNNGNGTFTDVTQKTGAVDRDALYGFGVLWLDVNEDGWPDIFVANDSTPNLLFLNKGDGTFEEFGLLAGLAYNEDGREQACMGVDAGDYDNDGKLDLYVTNFSDDYNTLYHNLGKARFMDRTFQAGLGEPTLPFLGFGTFFFDFDNDGWTDIFVANGHIYPEVDVHKLGTTYRQKNQLFLNQKNGTFRELKAAEVGPGLAIEKSSRGAAYADLDNDGDLDLVIVNIDDYPDVLYNQGGENNWVAFQTRGAVSNRDGVGSRLMVTSGELKQHDEVRSGNSYLSHCDFRKYFGLGKRARVDEVSVRWPSGKIQTHKDLEARHLYLLEEGKGIKKLW